MAYIFYDIESLQNLFTIVTYRENKPIKGSGIHNAINVYYIDDNNLMYDNKYSKTKPEDVPNNLSNKSRELFWAEQAVNQRLTLMFGKENNNQKKSAIALIRQRIFEKNPILQELEPTIDFYDMTTPIGLRAFLEEFLYQPIGKEICKKYKFSLNKPNGQLVKKTISVTYDTDIDPKTNEFDSNKYPYLLGYNSFNYDTTILAYIFTYILNETRVYHDDSDNFDSIVDDIDATFPDMPNMAKDFTASNIREFNDALFTEEYKGAMTQALSDDELCPDPDIKPDAYFSYNRTLASRIRSAMIATGRHLDVARLNEKQAKVGLKRLLGMMGYQILESDKLSEQNSTLTNFDELCDLIAYNVSDVVYLAKLFEDPVYKSQFEQKSNMLKAYPELIYNYASGSEKMIEENGVRKANIDKKSVRSNRLYADSSSQQLASRSLCPDAYNGLVDAPKVSLFYPHESNVSPEKGINRRDILEEATTFFMTEVVPLIKDDEERKRATDDFGHIRSAYKLLTQHNFDSGKTLEKVLNTKTKKEVNKLAEEIVHEFVTSKENLTISFLRAKTADVKLTDESLNSLLTTLNRAKAELKTLKSQGKNDELKNCAYKYRNIVSNILWSSFDVKNIKDIACGLPYNIFYYDGEGNRTSCFATFSTGGIHGAEYAMITYENAKAAAEEYNENLNWLKDIFGHDQNGAKALRASVKTAATPIDAKDGHGNGFPDGREDHLVSEFLSNVTKANAAWSKEITCSIFEQRDEEGPNKLRSAYTWTSATLANHEDFASYYPNLLRMMGVFYNDQLGYDRYGEIYAEKENLGRRLKQSTDPDEKYKLSLDRAGVKLILNTASGAGDAKFDNPVRMNNNIIAMRVIGQLFTWLIAQTQALHGAKIVSTNTDGLYTKLEAKKNNALLAEVSKKIGIDIEPELMYLISKDSNNRIEFDIVPCTSDNERVIIGYDENQNTIYAKLDERRGLTDSENNPLSADTFVKFKVLSVAGATLACREGPNPARSLAHSAVTDWALSEYLMRTFAKYNYRQSALKQEFDYALGNQIIKEMYAMKDSDDKNTRIHGLLMFQNVIASNPASYTYIYKNDFAPAQEELLARLEYWNDTAPELPANGLEYYDNHGNPTPLQHYNRVFIMKPGTKNTVHLYDAVARIVPKPTVETRKKKNEPITRDLSRAATFILQSQNLSVAEIHGINADEKRDIISKKHSGIEPEWYMRIENRDLNLLSDEEINEIYNNLELPIYLSLLADVFENNWRNHVDYDTYTANNEIAE